ncbi:PDDEXK nuclease domain-containing protein [Microcoleus sp. bin38.metabat.b11b12b14.051]|uniref:PDDEXK nuclease domain-containing protein n=1 Tax=Microcoleus sp. bin38.metabat.b11b12b14.051 TaxID=2742709 RepID=UPI0025FCBDB2|nr:PDDEXK nuclease domain-containing protein [Microcoleus sp. bin38.metabat.b11b12b14.051]
MTNSIPEDYKKLLTEVKQRVRSAQYEALKAVNKQLIELYWDIGKTIVTRQQGASWGKSVVEQLAKDLQAEFPGISGFSDRNIWNMRNFYTTYSQNEKLQPMVAEIGWTHNGVILEKCKPDENPAIGIILCKSKNKTIVEYALRESNKPIGVATYKIVSTVPQEFKNQLPAPEQVAKLLEGID